MVDRILIRTLSYTHRFLDLHRPKMMDLKYNHGSEIQVVRANQDDATDLVAIGGMHSVQVLLTVRVVPLVHVQNGVRVLNS